MIRKKFKTRLAFCPNGRVAVMYSSYYILPVYKYIQSVTFIEEHNCVTSITKRMSFEKTKDAEDFESSIRRLYDVKNIIDSLKK